ncbi:MAG: hypothetical protein J6P73_09570 [Bacteroidales bacterium]|nr:hypothetical protein [Bacteroidales bacterium]
MKRVLIALMILLLCGAFTLAEAQKPIKIKPSSDTVIKKTDKTEPATTNPTNPTDPTNTDNGRTHRKSNKGNSATFISLTSFHFEKGMFAWHPRIQYGTYLTNHLAWLLGVGYDMNREKVETIDKKLKTRTLSVPLTLRYGIGKTELAQVHAGVSYNYIASKRLGGEKMDLTGTKRGYFSGHVRVSLIGLMFLEYEYCFNRTIGTDPRPGMFYYGFCLDF